MLCPYPDCTGQVVEGQRFCNICGRSLDPQAVAAAKQAASAAPTSQPLPPYQAPPYSQPPYQAPPYANQPYGNPPQYPPPQYPPPPYEQYPPQQMPPTQPYAQSNWQGQPYAQMPVQQVAPKPASKVPLVIFLILLLLGGGVAAGFLILGWRLPTINSTTSSSITPTLGTKVFHLSLPVFERDNPYNSEPIKGRDGLERRITLTTNPYTTNNGSTRYPATVDVSLKAANIDNLTPEQIFSMGMMFTTSQELADQMKSESVSRYPDYKFDTALATKGKSLELTDDKGWRMKITVDDVALDSATMTDGSPSPHPIFMQLELTVELTPK